MCSCHLPNTLKVFRRILLLLNFGFAQSGARLFDLKRLAILQVLAEPVDHLAEDAVGLALVRFVGADLVDQVVDDVAQVHGIQHAEAEIDGELQSGLARGGLDSVAVLEQQDAEAVEAGILQRETIFGLVHAEAAGTARAGGKEDVVVQNLLAWHAFFLQELQILHQIADGEVGRIALAVVAEFLAGLEGRRRSAPEASRSDSRSPERRRGSGPRASR